MNSSPNDTPDCPQRKDGTNAPMVLACPSCGYRLRLSHQHLGLKGNCVSCKTPIMGAEVSPGKFAAVLAEPETAPKEVISELAPSTKPPSNKLKSADPIEVEPTPVESPFLKSPFGKQAEAKPNRLFGESPSSGPSPAASPERPKPTSESPFFAKKEEAKSEEAPSKWGFGKPKSPDAETVKSTEDQIPKESPKVRSAPKTTSPFFKQAPAQEKKDADETPEVEVKSPFNAPNSQKESPIFQSQKTVEPIEEEKAPPFSNPEPATVSEPVPDGFQSPVSPIDSFQASPEEVRPLPSDKKEVDGAATPFGHAESGANSSSLNQFSSSSIESKVSDSAVPEMKTPFDAEEPEENSENFLKSFLTEPPLPGREAASEPASQGDEAKAYTPDPINFSNLKLKRSPRKRSLSTPMLLVILFVASLLGGVGAYVWTPPAQKMQFKAKLADWLAPGAVVFEKLPFGLGENLVPVIQESQSAPEDQSKASKALPLQTDQTTTAPAALINEVP